MAIYRCFLPVSLPEGIQLDPLLIYVLMIIIDV